MVIVQILITKMLHKCYVDKNTGKLFGIEQNDLQNNYAIKC